MTDIKIEDQPPPKQRDPTAKTIQSLVIEDVRTREQIGMERYGVPLRTHDGRITIVDAYQEALDLVVYLRKIIAEGGLVGRHGTDDSPYDPLTEGMTPGKLLARILDGDEKQRLDLCGQLVGSARHSWKCFEHDHVGRIESLEQQVTKLSKALVRCMNGTPIAPDSDVARSAKWEAERDERESRFTGNSGN